ncbi:MAG: hypothetical protein ACP5HX_10330 [Thermoproteota archaeon]
MSESTSSRNLALVTLGLIAIIFAGTSIYYYSSCNQLSIEYNNLKNSYNSFVAKLYKASS